MRSITPNEITGNVFDRIGGQWMLITAKNGEKVNTMTASWGGMGVMWNKKVTFCLIRPQRYTYEFMEKTNLFTLSFFDEGYRSALNLLGMKSGRDGDKIGESGLTLTTDGEFATFEQAKLVLRCEKLYAQDIKPESFIDASLCEAMYPHSDFHRLYVSEILEVYRN